MACWRYLRDVFITVAVLLVAGGLVVSWCLFSVLLALAAAVGSLILDTKIWRKK